MRAAHIERNGQLWECKEPTTDNGQRAIQNSIAKAAKQERARLLIRLKESYSAAAVQRGLIAATQPLTKTTLELVDLQFHDGSTVRFTIEELRGRGFVDRFKKTTGNRLQ